MTVPTRGWFRISLLGLLIIGLIQIVSAGLTTQPELDPSTIVISDINSDTVDLQSCLIIAGDDRGSGVYTFVQSLTSSLEGASAFHTSPYTYDSESINNGCVDIEYTFPEVPAPVVWIALYATDDDSGESSAMSDAVRVQFYLPSPPAAPTSVWISNPSYNAILVSWVEVNASSYPSYSYAVQYSYANDIVDAEWFPCLDPVTNTTLANAVASPLLCGVGYGVAFEVAVQTLDTSSDLLSNLTINYTQTQLASFSEALAPIVTIVYINASEVNISVKTAPLLPYDYYTGVFSVVTTGSGDGDNNSFTFPWTSTADNDYTPEQVWTGSGDPNSPPISLHITVTNDQSEISSDMYTGQLLFPPSDPGNLTLVAVGPTSISLSWVGATTDGGIITYNVQQSTWSRPNNWADCVGGTGISATSLLVTGLTSGTGYNFRVITQGEYTTSGNYGFTYNVFTSPVHPNNVRLEGDVGSTTVTLAWDPVDGGTGNPNPVTYSVYISTFVDGAFNPSELYAPDLGTTSLLVSGLTPSTTLRFLLFSQTREDATPSPAAFSDLFTTLADSGVAQTVISDVQTPAENVFSLTLSMPQLPNNTGSTGVYYVYIATFADDGPFSPAAETSYIVDQSNPFGTTEVTISDYGFNIMVWVRAWCHNDYTNTNGTFSSIFTVTLPPADAFNLTYTITDEGAVNLFWDTQFGGANTYNIMQSLNAGDAPTIWTSSVGGQGISGTNFTVTGLVSGKGYYFSIQSIGIFGIPSVNNLTNSDPIFTLPPGPTGFEIVNVGSDGSITFSWDLQIEPDNLNGVTTLLYHDNPPTLLASLNHSTGTTIHGLALGTPYLFRLYTSNGFGISVEYSETGGPVVMGGQTPSICTTLSQLDCLSFLNCHFDYSEVPAQCVPYWSPDNAQCGGGYLSDEGTCEDASCVWDGYLEVCFLNVNIMDTTFPCAVFTTTAFDTPLACISHGCVLDPNGVDCNSLNNEVVNYDVTFSLPSLMADSSVMTGTIEIPLGFNVYDSTKSNILAPPLYVFAVGNAGFPTPYQTTSPCTSLSFDMSAAAIHQPLPVNYTGPGGEEALLEELVAHVRQYGNLNVDPTTVAGAALLAYYGNISVGGDGNVLLENSSFALTSVSISADNSSMIFAYSIDMTTVLSDCGDYGVSLGAMGDFATSVMPMSVWFRETNGDWLAAPATYYTSSFFDSDIVSISDVNTFPVYVEMTEIISVNVDDCEDGQQNLLRSYQLFYTNVTDDSVVVGPRSADDISFNVSGLSNCYGDQVSGIGEVFCDNDIGVCTIQVDIQSRCRSMDINGESWLHCNDANKADIITDLGNDAVGGYPTSLDGVHNFYVTSYVCPAGYTDGSMCSPLFDSAGPSSVVDQTVWMTAFPSTFLSAPDLSITYALLPASNTSFLNVSSLIVFDSFNTTEAQLNPTTGTTQQINSVDNVNVIVQITNVIPRGSLTLELLLDNITITPLTPTGDTLVGGKVLNWTDILNGSVYVPQEQISLSGEGTLLPACNEQSGCDGFSVPITVLNALSPAYAYSVELSYIITLPRTTCGPIRRRRLLSEGTNTILDEQQAYTTRYMYIRTNWFVEGEWIDIGDSSSSSGEGTGESTNSGFSSWSLALQVCVIVIPIIFVVILLIALCICCIVAKRRRSASNTRSQRRARFA